MKNNSILYQFQGWRSLKNNNLKLNSTKKNTQKFILISNLILESIIDFEPQNKVVIFSKLPCVPISNEKKLKLFSSFYSTLLFLLWFFTWKKKPFCFKLTSKSKVSTSSQWFEMPNCNFLLFPENTTECTNWWVRTGMILFVQC